MNFPHDVEGWLSETEGFRLADLARGKRVLEIGSYCGRSTICMAQTAESVVALDPHDGRATPRPKNTLQEMIANLERYGVRERVEIVTDLEAEIQPGFGLAFIDGAHDTQSVRNDIRRVCGLLSPGGLIAFHDYRIYPREYDGRWDPGVTQAVNEFLSSGALLLGRYDTLAVVDPLVSNMKG